MKTKYIINLIIGILSFVLIMFTEDTKYQILLSTATIIIFGSIPNYKEE